MTHRQYVAWRQWFLDGDASRQEYHLMQIAARVAKTDVWQQRVEFRVRDASEGLSAEKWAQVKAELARRRAMRGG